MTTMTTTGTKLRVGSLFAGIGGFDLGFENAGMEVVWQVENEKWCQKVLQQHWPLVPLYGDVADQNGDELPGIDVLCGGFPCQDISQASAFRPGLAGPRSYLWWEFARLIGEISPPWVVIENVLGLLHTNGGRDMGAILGTLGALGYGFAYRVLDAQWFGLAQRRRRVFIVANLAGPSGPAKVLFEPEGPCRDVAPDRPEEEARPPVVGGVAYRFIPDLAFTLEREHGTRYNINGRGTFVVDGDNRIRRMTTLEKHRLQGFPEGWLSAMSDSMASLQLGNAVAVPVAEWIARRIVGIEKAPVETGA